MQVLRLMALPLFALSLSVSITGCDQKNDTLQGNQNNMTAFIKKIAASKESEETQRYALMNPLMILVKIIKLRWIHILSYDQMVVAATLLAQNLFTHGYALGKL